METKRTNGGANSSISRFNGDLLRKKFKNENQSFRLVYNQSSSVNFTQIYPEFNMKLERFFNFHELHIMLSIAILNLTGIRLWVR